MTRTRVLFADSEAPFRSAAQRALERMGYEVAAVADGAEAVALLERESFDVIVADVAMPRMDGIQVLRYLKAQKVQVPVILLSYPRTLGSAAIGVRSGAVDYLVKPVDDLERIGDMIKRALGPGDVKSAPEQRAANASSDPPPAVSPSAGGPAQEALSKSEIAVTPSFKPPETRAPAAQPTQTTLAATSQGEPSLEEQESVLALGPEPIEAAVPNWVDDLFALRPASIGDLPVPGRRVVVEEATPVAEAVAADDFIPGYDLPEPGQIAPVVGRPDLRVILQPILGALTTRRPPEDMFSALAAAFAGALQTEHAAVLLAREEHQLQLVGASGYGDLGAALTDYGQQIGHEAAWQSITSGQPAWCEAEPSRGTPSRVALPLVFDERIVGAAVLYPVKDRRSYSPDELDLLGMLCLQGAVCTEMVQLQTRVAALQPNDELTGVLNRDHLLHEADREFRRSWRFGQPIALVVVDIDSFEKVNTTLTLTGGDNVLKQVAATLRRATRSIDLVGRLDEDNFGVLLLMATAETARQVAERLRRAITEIQVDTPEGPLQVTGSLGVAAYPREGCTSVYDLLAVAEQALHVSKRAGRNRVSML